MSKIKYLRAIMEHHGLEYTINGKDTSIGGYNGMCVTDVNKLDIMVNASTLESCIIQMETAIDAYLTKEYYSLPIITIHEQLPLKPVGWDRTDGLSFAIPVIDPKPIINSL